MPQTENPPTRAVSILRQVGPGLIITASIVGSGELIVTPKLGSEVGFTLLWFIIAGCLIKVFVQIELGRYAIASGQTTIAALDTIPGPRARVSWLVWLWLLMFIALPFQVAGMMGGIAGMATLAGAPASMEPFIAAGVAVITAALLASGRYRLVQNLCTAMVVFFTLFTVSALAAVQGTPFRITGSQLLEGFSFRLPGDFSTAFAAFGIIGVGASELIYYPYWCLEKGYGDKVGVRDRTPQWLARARGWVRVMRIDALLSLVVYTLATVTFYLLGAAILGGQGKEVTDANVIPHLSEMYTRSYGQGGLNIFLLGGFSVLFSTVFAATASNARLLVDGLKTFRIAAAKGEAAQARFIKLACIGLSILSLIIYLRVGKVVLLVFIGALAQGLMLPFLAGAALYFRLKRHRDVADDPDHPWQWKLGTLMLSISAFCMGAVGLYQVAKELLP